MGGAGAGRQAGGRAGGQRRLEDCTTSTTRTCSSWSGQVIPPLLSRSSLYRGVDGQLLSFYHADAPPVRPALLICSWRSIIHPPTHTPQLSHHHRHRLPALPYTGQHLPLHCLTRPNPPQRRPILAYLSTTPARRSADHLAYGTVFHCTSRKSWKPNRRR